MTSLWKESINIAAAIILLPFLITNTIIPFGQHHHHLRFTAEAGEGGDV